MTGREKVLGQFFTKEKVAKRLVDIVLEQRKYGRKSRILEPSSGTGNFIRVLNGLGFHNMVGCEIDESLADNPVDFFDYPLSEKFDLIIGNPPFTKYNMGASYYHVAEHLKKSPVHPETYLTKGMLKHGKERIENIFIAKSMKHLKDERSAMGLILPISFFIKDRNKDIKAEISRRFSTIIVYQDDEVWFNYSIPCCFALMLNTKRYDGKIILIFGDERDVISKSRIHEEIIPKTHFNKKNGIIKNHAGTPLLRVISKEPVRYKMSYTKNNVSAKNILGMARIPGKDNVRDYKLAITRVGNASVGKCGLINIKRDTLNDMFFVFDFLENYDNDKDMKERVCSLINGNQDYFRNITCRVGSKSIKKSDVLNLRIPLKS